MFTNHPRSNFPFPTNPCHMERVSLTCPPHVGTRPPVILHIHFLTSLWLCQVVPAVFYPVVLSLSVTICLCPICLTYLFWWAKSWPTFSLLFIPFITFCPLSEPLTCEKVAKAVKLGASAGHLCVCAHSRLSTWGSAMLMKYLFIQFSTQWAQKCVWI